MKLRVLHEGQTIIYKMVLQALAEKYFVDYQDKRFEHTMIIRRPSDLLGICRIKNFPDSGNIMIQHNVFDPDSMFDTRQVRRMWPVTVPDIIDKVVDYVDGLEKDKEILRTAGPSSEEGLLTPHFLRKKKWAKIKRIQ